MHNRKFKIIKVKVERILKQSGQKMIFLNYFQLFLKYNHQLQNLNHLNFIREKNGFRNGLLQRNEKNRRDRIARYFIIPNFFISPSNLSLWLTRGATFESPGLMKNILQISRQELEAASKHKTSS